MIVVGSFDRSMVGTFKRTEQYTIEDFDLVMNIIRRTDRIVTLSSILTEVSNLAGQLRDDVKSRCFAVFARQIELMEEQQLLSADIARSDEFPRFGLTDAAILKVAQSGRLVLTDDFRLSQYIDSLGLPVLNFNHLRGPNLLR